MAMESDCPACIRRHSNLYVNCSVLYYAVAEKDNAQIDAILNCKIHKVPLLNYVHYRESHQPTPLLKAVMTDNYEVIAKLVRAGANIAYTTPTGVNALNYSGAKNRSKILSTIVNSISSLDQIQSFCRGMFNKKMYDNMLNGQVLCSFLNSMSQEPSLPMCVSILDNKRVIGKVGQKKVQEFCAIQRKKLEILLKHAEKTARLPGDMVRIIASLVFAEPV